MFRPFLAIAIGATLTASPLWAAAAPAAKPAAAPAAAAAPKLDPDSLAALDRMGAYLRTLPTFAVTSHSTMEEVLTNGQKLQFLNRVRYVAQKPDKLFAELRSDRHFARIFYNGQTFTVYTPTNHFYAQAPVTGTIGSVLKKADEKFGIEFPLQDLFRWGDPSATAEVPTEGFKVGTAQIGAFATDHYAFRQKGVDFQIWIDQGDKPLPRKLVITTLSDPAQPEYVAYFAWDMAPKLDGNSFTFVADKDDVKIPLATAGTPAAK